MVNLLRKNEWSLGNKDILDYVSKICKLVTYFLISGDGNGYDYESFQLNELSKSYIIKTLKRLLHWMIYLIHQV